MENKMNYAEESVINAIRAQFTDQNAEIFLTPHWQNERRDKGITEIGFCLLASRAYFHFMDGDWLGFA